MTQICYIYVFKYRILENIGIGFNPAYEYNMDGTDLSITSSKHAVPNGFWGSHISSLSAIVGENGVGKSTILDVLFSICVEGSDSRDTEALIVYEQEGQMRVFIPKGRKLRVTLNGIEVPSTIQPSVYSTYYSGYFSPYFSYNYPRDTELTGSYNMSDGYLILKDLQDYTNIDTMHFTESIYMHYQKHIAQDNFRIACMLADKNLREQLKYFALPEFLIVTPNTSGYDAIRCDKLHKFDGFDIPEYTKPMFYSEEELLFAFTYYNFLNIIAECKNKNGIEYLKGWIDACDRTNDILDQFREFINSNVDDPYYRKLLFETYKVLCELTTNFRYSEVGGCFFTETKYMDDTLSEWMQRVFKDSYYLVAKYFDIGYSRSADPNMRLSTGELVVLKLFSRLYYVLRLKYNKISNLDLARFVLLDEAEIGFHPDWQRMFVSNLVDFVNSVVEDGEDPVQIILTSHSPFMLSDFPSDCVTYLRKQRTEGGFWKPVVADKTNITSFGANLYDMFKTGYFLKSSIGDYAQRKIRWVYDIYNVEDLTRREQLFKENYDQILYIVNSIADPFLSKDAKSMFYEMCLADDKDKLKALLEKEIQEKQDIIARL